MSDQPPDEYHKRQQVNLLVLAIAAILIIGTVLLLVALHRGIRQESCFAANHRSCAPIDER